mgnify:CR=1 FL=1
MTTDNQSSRADQLNMMGIALLAAGKTQEAVQRFSEALEIRQDHVIARGNRARAYQEMGDLIRAQSEFEIALGFAREAEDRAIVHNNTGLLFTVRGDDDRAIEEYDRAIQYDPDLALAYYNRANVHFRRGDQAAMMADVRRAIALDPSIEGMIFRIAQGEI